MLLFSNPTGQPDDADHTTPVDTPGASNTGRAARRASVATGCAIATLLTGCGTATTTENTTDTAVKPFTQPLDGTTSEAPKPGPPKTSGAPKPGPPKTSGATKPPGNTGNQPGKAPASSAGFPVCDVGTLPQEADQVIDDILAGGPFEYPGKDGSTFGNRERILPQKKRGFYREHTVTTPGLHHRGARRIVTGGSNATNPDKWYYTDDHYESFCLIWGI